MCIRLVGGLAGSDRSVHDRLLFRGGLRGVGYDFVNTYFVGTAVDFSRLRPSALQDSH